MKHQDILALVAANNLALARVANALDSMVALLDRGSESFSSDLPTAKMTVPDHLLAEAADPRDSIPMMLPPNSDLTPAGPVTRKLGSVPPGVPAAAPRRPRK